MTDRLPPNDIGAEQAVLGAVLIDPDAIARLSDALPVDAFFDGRHQTVYRAMLALWEVKRPADIVTLSALLRQRGRLDDVGGLAYLAELQAASPSAYYVDHYAGILRELAARRALIAAGADLVRRAYDGAVDVDDAVGAVRRSVDPFRSAASDSADYGDLMDAHRQRVIDRWENRLLEHVVPTGMKSIDRIVMGGFRSGDLVFVGARPGMGKTSLMLQLAQHAARATGKLSLIVELEMGREALLNRAISAEAGVPFAVAYQSIGDRDQRERWLAASAGLEALPVAVETGLTTTDNIAAYCERLRAEREIGAIYVDHLDYLTDRVRGDSTEQRTAELTRRCKQLAQRADCPVIVLSQLNREVESAKPFIPTLKNFRNSGAIEQDTDYAFLLYRRMYYVAKGMLEPDAGEDWVTATNLHKVELFLAKNRNGEVMSIPLGWQGETMTFHEIDRRAA